MSKGLPYATPYPWDNPKIEEAQRQSNKKLRKRPFVGSGLAALRKNAFGSQSSMGGVAQGLLRNLLQQHSLESDFTDSEQANTNQVYGVLAVSQGVDSKEAITSGTSEEDLCKKSRNGEISLFLSLLKIINDNRPNHVPTKTLLRQCCIGIRPGDVPGSIDAKEMILAALHFLSSKFGAATNGLVTLPLIKPLQELGDLERRSWQKAGDWTLSDIREPVLRLERIFISSPSSWRWLKREKLCPRLSSEDENFFFLKGAIPVSAAAKKILREPTRKRKVSSSPPPSSPSLVQEAPVEPLTPAAEETTVHEVASPSISEA